MSWTSVRIRGAADREAVVAALFAAGSLGVQEEGDALVTHFPPEADLERVQRAVAAASPGAEIELGRTPDVDWSEAWKQAVRAHRVGDLWIAPPWLAAGSPAERTVVIDPGMAFGTGEHATTRGVLRLMQGAVRPGDRVADLGAGSAALAIGAAKLGAARVVAIEIDPDAIPDAEENVARNGVADRVTVLEGDAELLLPLVAPVRLVLANIISSVLAGLLPTIADSLAPDGRAILSGILAAERDEMLALLRRHGWRVDAEDHEDIWWSVRIARR